MNVDHTQALPHRDRRPYLALVFFIFLMYGAAGTAGATLAASPVLSYDWSGDYGTVVADSSGNGNVGTNFNSNIYTMANGYRYRSFDTSGQWIQTPSSSSLNVGAITIEGMFSTDYKEFVHQTICLKRDYGSDGYWYGIDVSGRFYFYVYNKGEERLYLSNIYATDGKLHYITVTYDGQVMNFYDFGALKDSKGWGSFMPIGASNSLLYVGMPSDQHPFNGNLYMLRITGRALSPAEVATNVNNEATRIQSVPSGSQPTFDIKVKTGLNLVSLPLINNSIYASQLGLYGIRRVSAYDNSKGSYNTYVLGFSSPAQDIQIKPDQAYFLDSTIDYKIPVSGVFQEPRYTTISPGWNAVGWTSQSTIKASDLGSRLGDIQRVCRYNTATGTFDVYAVGFSGSDKNFDVKPGEGYFVYLQSNVPETLKLGG